MRLGRMGASFPTRLSFLRTLIRRLAASGAEVRRPVWDMDIEGFGGCTLFGECQEACPKTISIDTIARMNRDYFKANAIG